MMSICANAWQIGIQPGMTAKGTHPTKFAIHGQRLFEDLCEAITCYIERIPAVFPEDASSESEDWLCSRVPYRKIISLQTFGRFAEAMREPQRFPDWLMNRLSD